MNRSKYFNFIEEKINILATRIEARGKLNILDLHLHSENFYCHLLNKLYGWELQNLNSIQQNIEAIDLIDHTNKFIVQVSSKSTKEKIESSLAKELLKTYPDYQFKFISISKDSSSLRNKTFKNPNGITFDPRNDIVDKHSILSNIKDLEDLELIYEFIKKELGEPVNQIQLQSNLAHVINIISKENFNVVKGNKIPFDIDKKVEYNSLEYTKSIIDDYKLYYHIVDKKYKECDRMGMNKSFSVLQSFKKLYIELSKDLSGDKLFKQIAIKNRQKIIESSNYVEIPIEELDICIDILMVHAFMECKIFENPKN
jgi:hypothetical protein